MAFCTERRANPALQETHGGQAIQMQSLRQVFLPFRPPGSPHEETYLRWPQGEGEDPGHYRTWGIETEEARSERGREREKERRRRGVETVETGQYLNHT